MVKESKAFMRAMKTSRCYRLQITTALCILSLQNVLGLTDLTEFRIDDERYRSLQDTTDPPLASAPTVENSLLVEPSQSATPPPASEPSVNVQPNNGISPAPTVTTTEGTVSSDGEGVDETFLERRWDIPHPVAHYDQYTFTLEYRVSTYIENHMAEITLFDSSSCFEGTLVEPPTSHDISNNNYLSYLRTNQPSSESHSIANLEPGTRQINLTLTIEPDQIQNSPIFIDSGDHNELQFCVRIGLSTRDQSVEINNKETMVQLQLDQDNAIEKVSLFKKNVIDENTKDLFSVEAFQCDDNNMQISVDAPPLVHGDSVRICVRPTAAAIRNTATIRRINYFNFERDEVLQSAIENGEEASDGLTIFSCASGSSICAFTTLLNAEFYTFTGVVHGEGEALLQYVVIPDGRLRRRRVKFTVSTRERQTSSLGGTPILIDIPVKGSLADSTGDEELTEIEGDDDGLNLTDNNTTNPNAGTTIRKKKERPLYVKILVGVGIIALVLCAWDTLYLMFCSSNAHNDDPKTEKSKDSKDHGENERDTKPGIFPSMRTLISPSEDEPPQDVDDEPDVFDDEDIPVVTKPDNRDKSSNRRSSRRGSMDGSSKRRSGRNSKRSSGSTDRNSKRGSSTKGESSGESKGRSSRNSGKAERRSSRREGDGMDRAHRQRRPSRSAVEKKKSAEWGDLEVPDAVAPERTPRRKSKR